MGDVIIKAAKDRDLYLIWSTVVDGPVAVYPSVEDLREHLWKEYRRQHPHCVPQPGYGPNARITRADVYGSSAAPDDNGAYGWDEESWGIDGYGIPDGRWDLPRANLVAYVEAVLQNDMDAAAKQLRPYIEEDGCQVVGPST